MNTLVLDTWALLEWLLGQPAAPRVRELLAGPAGQQLLMSWVNIGEVIFLLERKGCRRDPEEFLRRLPSLPIRLVAPSAECCIRAARIRSQSNLSYADAFAIDLAKQEQGSIVTGDPAIAASGLVNTVWVGNSE